MNAPRNADQIAIKLELAKEEARTGDACVCDHRSVGPCVADARTMGPIRKLVIWNRQ